MPITSNFEGALSKWTNVIQGWQFRWFVLDVHNGLLSYFTSKENMSKGERRGCIRLKSAYVGYDNEDDITFTINTTDEKTFHLQAKNLDEREKWVSRIEKQIRLLSSSKQKYTLELPSSLNNNSTDERKKFIKYSSSSYDDEVHVSFQQKQNLHNSQTKIDCMKQFDSSITESDAYLQLLIEQLKELKEKRNNFVNENEVKAKIEKSPTENETSSRNNTNDVIKSNENYSSITQATENLIETLQHAIICLQIAKANTDSKNNLEVENDLGQAMLNFNKQVIDISSHSPTKETPNDSLNNSMSLFSNTSQQGASSLPSSNIEASAASKLESKASKSFKKKHVMMPMASYSSSDDEDTNSNSISNSIPNIDQNRTVTSCGAMQQGFNQDLDDSQDELDFREDDDEEEYSSLIFKRRKNEDNDSDSFYDAVDQTSQTLSSFTISEQTKFNSVVSDKNKDSSDQTQALTSFSLEKSQISNRNNSNSIQNELITHSRSSSPSSQFSVSPSPLPNPIDQKILDEYELFDEDAPPEDIDLNNQQSVITHLLTQVRIGMDLTKITLPTFILETRSLLEMYADFFAHTDLFLQIPDIKNARDRMVQVVKWYVSTFHAGRKSPVAKKPYNPILGELFQCWYDVPEFSTGDATLISDGPVPWANRDQLTFIAEQVSHHPPISAFYAEHFNKRIQLDGFTWTKSKFMGLSIGVHMVGQAVLRLLDHDEEYILTFPSAYGRSILTVPWFEMAGKVYINCAKSGYNATIDFLSKPFYGGKKHQIQGTIFGADKKALFTIDGDWNGTMFIKNGKKQDILISTQSTPTIKKKVRPLSEQSDYESRKLWREVTYYLRTKQIESATSAKQCIEQKQRDDTKDRKEKNLKWNSKYFHEQGENWIYAEPLVKRLQKS